MRTLRSAATLLASTTSIDCSAPLLTELGFSADVVILDDETRNRLGIEGLVDRAAMSAGPGAMRALLLELRQATVREALLRLSRRLASRAPHVLWVIIALNADTHEIAIASWLSNKTSLRIVALLANQNDVVDSDAETLCAMAAAVSSSDLATHTRWIDILGRESVSRRFFLAMRASVSQLATSIANAVPPESATQIALLHLSRLLFLSFLETKGWLNNDHAFLSNQFADCMLHGGGYHRRVLCPLFFGTLNTRFTKRAPRAKGFGRIPFLNGGLFTRSAIEKAHSAHFFSDDSLGDLFGQLLMRYRFTAREDTSVWSEAAIDPEMLGKAFESFMASPDRKNTGAFYTPQSLVEQLTTSALVSGLVIDDKDDVIAYALNGDIPSPRQRERLLESIARVRVLDPACGSGAFLVHTLERLSTLRIHLGDTRPLHAIRRDVLTRSIFGVDINPTAVWLCELRLWLSTAIQDPERDPAKVTPLQNLDRNIRVGDSLTAGAFQSRTMTLVPARITRVRAKYVRAVGQRKVSLARVLDRLERVAAIDSLDRTITALCHERAETLRALRSRDLFGLRGTAGVTTRARLLELRADLRLARTNRTALTRGSALPFAYETHFADVAGSGGFSIVIGNPPWVRMHNIDARMKESLARDFTAFRHAAWTSGAEAAAASRGFAAQADLAAVFIEQSLRLVADRGVIALVVPAKLWRSLAGGGIRAHVLHETEIVEIHDLTESPQAFDAAVYPSMLVARRKIVSPDSPAVTEVRLAVHRRSSVIHWRVDSEFLSLDATDGSPWLIIPSDVRTAFDVVRNSGRPLAASPLGRPLLGVKTGCNEAFVVSPFDEEHGCIEKELLRPLHRGETIRAWTIPPATERIIWTHANGSPMKVLPQHTLRRLSRFRSDLERRSDSKGTKWWTLFRTESADASKARVVWADFGRDPRAAVVSAGDPTVFINSCYVVPCTDIADAHALIALLNSPLAAAWLNTIAEPARGGYHRYLGWTVALLPIPKDWPRARDILAPFAQAAIEGSPPSADALMKAVLRAYRLRHSQVEALLLWNGR